MQTAKAKARTSQGQCFPPNPTGGDYYKGEVIILDAFKGCMYVTCIRVDMTMHVSGVHLFQEYCVARWRAQKGGLYHFSSYFARCFRGRFL